MKIDNKSIEFSKLFATYKEPFILFANSYLKDMAAAEDVYMEAIEAYWERREMLPPDTDVPAYLLTCVKHNALAFLRHQQATMDAHEANYEHQTRERNFRIASLEYCDPSALFTGEIERIVHETMAEFPEQTRAIFFRSRFEGKKNKEIAQEMGISVKAVEFHITKVLKVLRVRLRDYLLVMLLCFWTQ